MHPLVLLMLAPLFWSGNWLIGRGLHETFSPIGLNYWRWMIALAVLLIIVGPKLRSQLPVYRQHWKTLCVLGVLSIVAFQIMIYFGLRHTTVINAVVLNSTMPVFMVITSWIMLGETISWRQALGGAVSFTGVLAIVSRGDWANFLSIEFGIGDFIILLAMPVWAIYSGILKRSQTGLNGMETLAGMTAFAVVIMTPLYLVDAIGSGNHVPLTFATLGSLAYVGVIAAVGAFYCWNEGVRGAGPAAAGFMYHLLPAFASVGAVFLLGETLFIYQIAGITLILAGVYMSTRNTVVTR